MKAISDFSEPGRLVLALLLALGLHAVLLLGVSIDRWPSFSPPTPPQFKVQLALPTPALIAPLAEPALIEWLPPALPQLARTKTTVLEPAPPTSEPSPKPVVKTIPEPLPKPVAKPVPKPPPVVRPVSRPQPRTATPLSKPGAPLSKPTIAAKPVTPSTARRSERTAAHSGQRRKSTVDTPAFGRLDSAALLGQIASLETEQQRKASAGIRAQRVRLTDTRSAAGFYAADWTRKVTRVGEMNFPDIARRLNMSAGPLLEVAIRADGRLQEVRVVHSSGNLELDRAAQRIVEQAAPYPPFSPELRRDVDLLRIEAPWRFDPGGRIQAR